MLKSVDGSFLTRMVFYDYWENELTVLLVRVEKLALPEEKQKCA